MARGKIKAREQQETRLRSSQPVLRTRTEVHTFSKTQLAEIAKIFAKAQIIGPMLHGSIGGQSTKWLSSGGIEIHTIVMEEK